jgi:hypothetical protein
MTDDQARTRLRELLGSFEYAYAMGHGCSLGWHPSSEAIRQEVADLRARLYGDSS